MRPNTLSEACERILAGTPAVIAIPEVLDTFYGCPSPERKLDVIKDEPPLTGDLKLDAFVAAAAEYLAKQYMLPEVPSWVRGETRYLDEPWFTTDSDDAGMREYLTFTSPGEFKSRNIFTEERPLRRASQPQGHGPALEPWPRRR